MHIHAQGINIVELDSAALYVNGMLCIAGKFGESAKPWLVNF